MDEIESQFENNETIGQKLFKFRDYTPVPLLLLLFIVEKPTVVSATLGTALIFLGELFRIYSVSFIGGVSRTRSDALGQSLVTKGPFKWVRNPLYVGNLLITTGISFFSGHVWFVVIALALFSAQYYFIVEYEEQNLEKKFGESYSEYKKEVPAWFPKRLPGLDDIDWPETFSPALKSERRTLTAIAVVLTFVLFFSN